MEKGRKIQCARVALIGDDYPLGQVAYPSEGEGGGNCRWGWRRRASFCDIPIFTSGSQPEEEEFASVLLLPGRHTRGRRRKSVWKFGGPISRASYFMRYGLAGCLVCVILLEKENEMWESWCLFGQ